ncbi:MAG: hypothetical protein WBV80_21940 [Mycobacterium sp.]
MTYDREQAWRDAMAHYEAGVNGAMLAEYRCREKNCLLLRVWQTPTGPEFFAPSARVSGYYATAGQFDFPSFNRDGPKKTGDKAGNIDDPLISRQWLWLLCDHFKEAVWTHHIRQDFNGRTPGNPATVVLPRDTPGHE